MLFDLRGKRRRAVQATYLMLAVLLGGGLVLFGIGGDVSGGLFNAFEDGGGGNANSAIEDRIDQQEERLKANPQNTAVLQELVREYYQLANAKLDPQDTQFPDDAKADLRKAGAYWQRYLAAEQEKPSPDTALFAAYLRRRRAQPAEGGAEGRGTDCGGAERRHLVSPACGLRGSGPRPAHRGSCRSAGRGPRAERPEGGDPRAGRAAGEGHQATAARTTAERLTYATGLRNRTRQGEK